MRPVAAPAKTILRGAKVGIAAQILMASICLLADRGQVRADNIDDQLRKDAPKLIDYLKKSDMANVGVLRFRVKKGNELPTFSAGPLNTNMVTRLENLLVLACDEKAPIHLLYEPGQVITSQKSKLTYLNAQGRRELFKLKYPAIGHDKPVAADGFLTGRVDLTPDYSNTTVTIWAFKSSDSDVRKVLEFTVPTDRSILADIGESFIITKRGKGVDLDKAAVRSIKKTGLDPGTKDDKKDEIKPDDKKPGSLVDLKDFVQFKLIYNSDEQEVSTDAKKEKWQVPMPRKEHKVVMKIKNLTDKRIGVVLTVNGVNTVYDEDGDWRDVTKWVLDPKEEYTIKGYYRKDDTVSPFRVIPADEAGELMDDTKVGQITYAVFDEEPESAMKVSGLRGVTPWDLRQKQPANFSELLGKVKKTTGMKRSEGGILQPDDVPETAGPLKKVAFKNASFIGSRTIWYFDPSSFKKDDKGSKEKTPDK